MRIHCVRALSLGVMILAACAKTMPAYGQDATDDTNTLGAALIYRMEPYGFTEVSPRPIIDYSYGPFSISGSKADLRTPLSGESWGITLRARYRLGDGYEAGDDVSLTGMEDRDGSIWAGLGFNAELGPYDISAEWLTDTMDNSGGNLLEFGISRDFQMPGFQLTPRASVTWWSDETVDYYYGVLPGEATALRPEYEGEATTSFEVGVRAIYPLTPRHHLLFDVGATAHGDNIGDSPIVQDDVVGSVGIGYAFRF